MGVHRKVWRMTWVTLRSAPSGCARPGQGEIRTVELAAPGPDDVVVRTLFSGVSRGTETLVFRGGVPASQHALMRAPFQEGEFPGPVKYGYLNVGVVEQGPAALLGRTVFCLYPHQTRYVVPAAAVTPCPTACRPGAPCSPGTVETAVNALWDAAPLVGDRIAVVGGGMVGCCVAALLARFPGVRVQLVDVDPARAAVAAALGVGFATPEDAAGDCDLVVHASATRGGARPVAGAARRRGRGDRAELVRRPAGQRCRWARRSTPAGWRSAAARSARSPRPGAARRSLRRPAGAGAAACSPTRPSTRWSPARSPSPSCPRVMPRLAAVNRPALCPVSPTRHSRPERDGPCSASPSATT